MNPRVLVAGIGNVFLGDDGFGVEVVRRLSTLPLPDWVRQADYGISGLHLACDILDEQYDTVVLVDAAARGGRPGTVYLIEPDPRRIECVPDAHSMSPEVVLALLQALGGIPPRVLVVGCEPACIEETMGLSPVVADAVEDALRVVLDVINQHPCARRTPHHPIGADIQPLHAVERRTVPAGKR